MQNYAPVTPAPVAADWDVGIEVLPLGIFGKNTAARLLYQEFDQLIPKNFDESQLRLIYDLYWKKMAYKPSGTAKYFDFRELEHVYNIFALYYELDLTDEEDEELYD